MSLRRLFEGIECPRFGSESVTSNSPKATESVTSNSMDCFYVYRLFNGCETVYVGKGSHKGYLDAQKRKFACDGEIVERCASDKDAYRREIYWISQLNPTVNRHPGGAGWPRILSDDEVREKARVKVAIWRGRKSGVELDAASIPPQAVRLVPEISSSAPKKRGRPAKFSIDERKAKAAAKVAEWRKRKASEVKP